MTAKELDEQRGSALLQLLEITTIPPLRRDRATAPPGAVQRRHHLLIEREDLRVLPVSLGIVGSGTEQRFTQVDTQSLDRARDDARPASMHAQHEDSCRTAE